MQQQNQTKKSIKIMLKQTQLSNYFQKYNRWIDLLSRITQPQSKSQALGMFLQYFPFNFEQWLQYIQLNGPQKFSIAIKKNPKSYELWMKYLQYVRKSPIGQQPAKYKKQIQKAILQIGADSRTGQIYIQYYNMLSESYRYQYFKKIFTRALTNLQQIHKLFTQWFNSKSEQQLMAIAAKQTKGRFVVRPEQLQTFLTKQINQQYEKTLIYREKRFQLQSKIKVWYFNGNQKQIKQDQHIWRQMIDLDRKISTVQNTSYCYERMLMAQMHDMQVWEEVFHFLENQTNKYTKVLNMFRHNKQFFMNFDISLFFYWCDLEERQNANQARKMYLQITQHNPKSQVILRHIQFEIRQKQWQNARKLYDYLISQNQQDASQIQFLSYIIVQYSNYILKYYKDLQYPKKLFQTYFEYLPYNNYLFSNYLNFMKNFDNTEGYYDELMTIIIEGLKKAKKILNQDQFQKRVVKMVKDYLRNNLSSIYLIRMSQRKMMEFDKV